MLADDIVKQHGAGSTQEGQSQPRVTTVKKQFRVSSSYDNH
jgi:hypothetical protein